MQHVQLISKPADQSRLLNGQLHLADAMRKRLPTAVFLANVVNLNKNGKTVWHGT